MSDFPNNSYNHFPQYQSKYSGEEIDNLLDAVYNWNGGLNKDSHIVTTATKSSTLEEWWSSVLTSSLSPTNSTQAVSGVAVANWWNNKYANSGNWNSISSEKVVSKYSIDRKLEEYAPKRLEFSYNDSDHNIEIGGQLSGLTETVNKLETYTTDNVHRSLVLNLSEMPEREVPLTKIGYYQTGRNENKNPFKWNESFPSELISEFAATEVFYPIIYVNRSPEIKGRVQNQITRFSLIDKFFTLDGSHIISIYKGYLVTDKIKEEDGGDVIWTISNILKSNKDLRASYIVIDYKIGGDVLVYTKLQTMFS